ncbi:MAG: hypothetical protein HY042_07970 [Spirochaetia bacterium]|nr:hypothetical protein [Spirochaetia bacterium]
MLSYPAGHVILSVVRPTTQIAAILIGVACALPFNSPARLALAKEKRANEIKFLVETKKPCCLDSRSFQELGSTAAAPEAASQVAPPRLEQALSQSWFPARISFPSPITAVQYAIPPPPLS